MTSTLFDDVVCDWNELAKKWGYLLESKFKNRKWKDIQAKYGSDLALSDQELRTFGHWVLEEWIPAQETNKPKPTPPPVVEALDESEESEAVPNEHWQEHDRKYWYDETRDLYVVHLASRKHPIAIKGEIWAAIKDAYSNWSGSPASINEIARKFGMSRRTVQELLRCMGNTHDSSPWTDEELHKEKESILVEDLLRRKEERILIKAERDNWDRIKADAIKWQLFNRNVLSKLEATMQQPYQVPKLRIAKSDRRFVAVVSPTDFHHGKYSDDFEVGEQDNRQLQRQRLLNSADRVLSDVARHGKPERILVGLGSDWFNIDNDLGSTTSGTPQDCDGNPSEILATGCQLMVEYLDCLRQVAPVTAVLMSGNHDRILGVALMMYLAAWYRDAPDVQIKQNSASPRAYLEYGQNLLCFNHGDLVTKTTDLARLAAVDKPREWGRCAHKMVFTGHLHGLKLEEDRGFTRMQLPSLSGKDRWHDRHGYVGNRKQLAAVLVDHQDGLFGTLYAEDE